MKRRSPPTKTPTPPASNVRIAPNESVSRRGAETQRKIMSLRFVSAPPRLCERILTWGVVVLTGAAPLWAAEADKPAEAKPTSAATAPAYAEPADESDQYTVETLLTGLDNPCAITLRP